MSQMSNYTSDEVKTLARAPLVVGMMVVSASLSGPLGIVKELLAVIQSTEDASKQAPESSVLRSLFSPESMKVQNEQMAREKQQAMDKAMQKEKIRQAISILSSKGEASEVEAYKAMLIQAAEKTANASKEGSFLGIGGKRVSEEGSVASAPSEARQQVQHRDVPREEALVAVVSQKQGSVSGLMIM